MAAAAVSPAHRQHLPLTTRSSGDEAAHRRRLPLHRLMSPPNSLAAVVLLPPVAVHCFLSHRCYGLSFAALACPPPCVAVPHAVVAVLREPRHGLPQRHAPHFLH
ncbi:hypothetical protein DAI22_05g166601 [Oryza sativa Japonica Group]|nr:hypothetical protein DAI22_05g166601 [Oryza sativa Japonica Group]